MPDRYPERDIMEEEPFVPIDEADAILNGLIANAHPVAPQVAEQPQRVSPRFVEGPGYASIQTGRLPQFPIPRPQRDPLEEMRKTINAIQFQKANDAYKAALSFQAARAYRQDLDAGRPQAEALARWGHLLPGGLAGAAAMTRESRPAFTPTRLPGSEDLYQVGLRGERLFQYRPQIPTPTGPVQTEPLIGSNGQPIPGVRVARSRTGLHVVKEAPEEAKASPSLNFQMLKTAIDSTQKELNEFGKEDPEYKPLKEKLDGLKKELEAMRTKKPSVTGGTPFFKGTAEEKAALQKALENATPEDLERGRVLLEQDRARERENTSETGFPMFPGRKPAQPPGPQGKPLFTPKSQAGVDAVIKQANEAIRRDPSKAEGIRKRLKEMGIEVRE